MKTDAIFVDVEKPFDRIWHEDFVYDMDQIGYSRSMVQKVDSFIR